MIAKNGFAQNLIKAGVISPEQLEDAQKSAKETNVSVRESLVKLGYATAEEVIEAVAATTNLEYVNLKQRMNRESVISLRKTVPNFG